VLGNSQLYGGVVKFTARASMDDGLLDVCIIKGNSLWSAPFRALSVVTAEMGRHAEGLDYARRALESARAASNTPVVVDAITLLAYRQVEIGRYVDARATLEELLPGVDHGGMTRDQELSFWDVLSRADAGLGRFDEAASAADRAVALGEALARPPDLSWALQTRARLRLSRADVTGARADIERAIALLERMRATLPPRDLLKQGFADTLRDVFTLAIDLDVTRRDPAAALVMAEQARARAFQDLLATRELSSSRPASAPLGAKVGGLASGSSVEAPRCGVRTRSIDSPSRLTDF
jgi:tetratricopeptide (TPR) repeat protein